MIWRHLIGLARRWPPLVALQKTVWKITQTDIARLDAVMRFFKTPPAGSA
jgi:hypothetical protein